MRPYENEKKLEQINITVGYTLYDFVWEQSQKRNTTMSAYIRNLIGIEMLKTKRTTGEA